MSGLHDGGAQRDAAYYKSIGFMCGLEIHQRLATAQKLFCACPAAPGEADREIGTLHRYQRAVAGELGDIDRSAEFEELKERRFTYKVHDRHTCLVEIDEEPPHTLNDEALRLSLAFAKAFGMRHVDEMQPMRKEVVDGSDPSAFQRTTLIATDGRIIVDGHEIGMPSLFLEEESCSIVSSSEQEVVYDTERLGIPLVEIDTDPYIPTPAAAKAVAIHIGTVLRVSGRVQRGIGSIRQDVNVSIRGGARVEIKGLQEVDKIDGFVENEIARQQKLIEIRDALVKAGADVGEPVDVSHIFKEGAVKIITSHLSKGGVALAFGLRGYKGLLGTEVNPQRRLGTEISDYAKMAKVNGIIHSDENLAGYGFTDKELDALRAALGKRYDSFIIVAGGERDAKAAIGLAAERAKYAMTGVPLETRGVGNVELMTTKFLRPLPSGSRMYPETDARPIIVGRELLEWAQKNMPDIDAERRALESVLHSTSLAEQMILSPRLQLYKRISRLGKADPVFVANTILQKMTELRRGGVEVDSIAEERLAAIFEEYGKGHVTKQAVEELIREAARSHDDVAAIIKNRKLHRFSGKELEELVAETRRAAKGNPDANELRAMIMAKHRLNIDGAELNSLLAKR